VRGLCVSDVFISDKSLSCCSHDLLLTDIRQEQCEMILLAPHLVSKLTQRWAAALQEILIQHTDQIQCPFWWGALQLALGFSTISWQSWKGYPQTYIDRNILPYNYRFSSTMLMQAYDSNSAFNVESTEFTVAYAELSHSWIQEGPNPNNTPRTTMPLKVNVKSS